MNRKTSFVVFLVLSSLLNLVLAAGFFFGILFLYSLSLARILVLKSAAPVLLLAFLAAIVGSGMVWKLILTRLLKRPGFAERFGIEQAPPSRR